MKKSLTVVNALVGGALLTLVVAASTLLFLMLSTGDGPTRRTGLFGAVVFESREVRPGVTGAQMGVESTAALGGVFVAFAILVLLAQVAFGALKQYRAALVQERSHR